MLRWLMQKRRQKSTTAHIIIAGNIRKYRKAAKMTQRELGLALGFDEETAQSRIYQYESANRSPNKSTLERIAAALGQPFQVFFQEEAGIVQASDLEREFSLLKKEAERYGPATIRRLRRMLPVLIEGIDEEKQERHSVPGSTRKRKTA